MNKHREILLQGKELAEMLTESQAEEVHKAMERVRMGNSGYYYELARLIMERDALNIHNTNDTPPEGLESSDLFAVIDEDAFEQIQETARRLYLKSQRGYRGQQLTMRDSYDYWIMVATREFFRRITKDTPPEGLAESDCSDNTQNTNQ